MAMPREAEMEEPLCPAVRVSYSLSNRLVKTGKAAALSERIKAVKAPGKKLMRIALMTDVEKQLIVREIKQLMQNQRRFHKTEIGTEMSAGLRHGVNDLRAYLGRQARLVLRLTYSLYPAASGYSLT